MGSLSYGELAGERMKLGLLLHDPEEEHDCFSDNTHASHYYDALGIRNVYLGEYRRLDGKTMKGPGLSSLVAKEGARGRQGNARPARCHHGGDGRADEIGRGRRGLRPDDRRGQQGRQRAGPGGDRRAEHPDQVYREGRCFARGWRRSPSRAPTASTTRRRCSSSAPPGQPAVRRVFVVPVCMEAKAARRPPRRRIRTLPS